MLKAQDIEKSYGNLQVLQSVTLNLSPGDLCILLGPNGSGKTTFLKILAGIVHPDNGSIALDHQSPTSHPGSRTMLSYFPQRVDFPGMMQVREILEFFRKLRNLPGKRREIMIDLLDLQDFLEIPARECSGGMLQRVGLAVSLMPEVGLYLLDEPTLSLERKYIEDLYDYLNTLQGQNRAVLIATHVYDEVRKFLQPPYQTCLLESGKLTLNNTNTNESAEQ